MGLFLYRFTRLFFLQRQQGSLLWEARFQQHRNLCCYQFFFYKVWRRINFTPFWQKYEENPSPTFATVKKWVPCLYVVIYYLCFASPWMKQNSDHPGYCWSNSKANIRRHRISDKSVSEQMGISCERDGSFNHEGREPTNSPESTTQVLLFSTNISFSITFPVKWAAEAEGCANVWNWYYGKGWASGSAVYWWRFVSLGLWCKLLKTSSVELP